jgi:hypothetical protein
MPVIPEDKVADKKTIIGKNEGCARFPDFSWLNKPKRTKMYQNTTKFTKWP